MKCLYFILFVAVAQGFVLENERVKRASLKAPSLRQLTAIDPAGFQVDWTPVTSGDPADPVTGYKIKVWELPNKKIYQLIDGVMTLVDEEPPTLTDDIPTSKPHEYITDKTTFVVKNLKRNVFYETRVQAYTKSTEGPLSNPWRIKLTEDKHAKDFYNLV
ncbi:contactin-like [Pectinophora gossypiella]|uniref:contactin-like n=1 Tax=Pectinophora gossypiella TaxID=13191 RepID=UPI00214E1211|nr:contactin-like [Pectinophora gossypiella]